MQKSGCEPDFHFLPGSVVAMTSKKLKKIAQDDKDYLFQNYGDRLPVCFVKGDGSYLFDQDGRRYVDFFSGIAVCNFGYLHKPLQRALHEQIDKIIHSSNWYYNAEQIDAARLISQLSFPGKTLFLNSGTEANEAAIKLARRYGKSRDKRCSHIISFENSFHGRTYGSMSATGQEKIRKGFEPLVPGFIILPFNDLSACKKVMRRNKKICAVITELIQGEGGIQLADSEFITELFNLCREREILLIVDEVQTGIGRTGTTLAYQHYAITPDILTLAKGLGGGIPIGALHARNEIATFLERGSHGSTFGGNHLACAAAVSVLKELQKQKTADHIRKTSEFFFSELMKLKDEIDFIQEVRGLGLHIGIELNKPGMGIVTRALENGLIINCTAETVIRIMPPLNIPLKVVREGMQILRRTLIDNR